MLRLKLKTNQHFVGPDTEIKTLLRIIAQPTPEPPSKNIHPQLQRRFYLPSCAAEKKGRPDRSLSFVSRRLLICKKSVFTPVHRCTTWFSLYHYEKLQGQENKTDFPSLATTKTWHNFSCTLYHNKTAINHWRLTTRLLEELSIVFRHSKLFK